MLPRGFSILAVALGLILLGPGSASAAPAPRVRLAAALEDAVPTVSSIQARLGQKVTLHAVVQLGARIFSDAPTLIVDGRRLRPGQVKPLSALGATRFAWYLVEPQQHHTALPSRNGENPAYSNAVLFGPTHGTWKGFDTLEYFETALPNERRSSLILSRATPTHPRLAVHAGLGTMRYRVQIWNGARALSSPGAESVGPQGILPSVMRVSYRDGDDLVGYLSAYFNVPNVFGSGGSGSTHQTELFQGADCADVIVGASRLAGARLDYTSALGLRRYARPVSPRLLLDESGIYELRGREKGKRVELVFGEDVKRGDLMLIDYLGFADSPREWDHVAVLARDDGQRGVLDPLDRVMHMGYLYGLVEAEAHTEGPAVVQFLRLRPRRR